MHLLISIITPAYNAGRVIDRAIVSVKAQTYPHWELIIIDDHSSDNTVEIAEKVAGKDSRIRVLRNQVNRGPAATRNIGINLAKGDWIAVLDADDAFLPDRLERIINAIESTGPDFIVDNMAKLYVYPLMVDSRPYWINWGSCEMSTLSLTEMLRNSTGLNKSYGVLKPLIRREFLLKNDLFYNERLRLGEDIELYCRILLRNAKSLKIHAIGYLYQEEPPKQSGAVETKASMMNKTDGIKATESILRNGNNLFTWSQRFWLFVRLYNMKSYVVGREIKLLLADQKLISALALLFRNPWFAIKLCLKIYLSYADKRWSHYALISSAKR